MTQEKKQKIEQTKEQLEHLTPAQIEHLLIKIPQEIETQDVKYKAVLEEKENAKYNWEYQQAVARMKYHDDKKKVDHIKAEIMQDEDVREAKRELVSKATKYEAERLERERVQIKLYALQSLIKLKALEYDRAGRQ